MPDPPFALTADQRTVTVVGEGRASAAPPTRPLPQLGGQSWGGAGLTRLRIQQGLLDAPPPDSAQRS
jgi:hypothetical protein